MVLRLVQGSERWSKTRALSFLLLGRCFVSRLAPHGHKMVAIALSIRASDRSIKSRRGWVARKRPLHGFSLILSRRKIFPGSTLPCFLLSHWLEPPPVSTPENLLTPNTVRLGPTLAGIQVHTIKYS